MAAVLAVLAIVTVVVAAVVVAAVVVVIVVVAAAAAVVASVQRLSAPASASTAWIPTPFPPREWPSRTFSATARPTPRASWRYDAHLVLPPDAAMPRGKGNAAESRAAGGAANSLEVHGLLGGSS